MRYVQNQGSNCCQWGASRSAGLSGLRRADIRKLRFLPRLEMSGTPSIRAAARRSGSRAWLRVGPRAQSGVRRTVHACVQPYVARGPRRPPLKFFKVQLPKQPRASPRAGYEAERGRAREPDDRELFRPYTMPVEPKKMKVRHSKDEGPDAKGTVRYFCRRSLHQ